MPVPLLFLLGAICAVLCAVYLGLEMLIRRRAVTDRANWDTRTLPAPDLQATRIVVLGDSIAYGQYLDETLAWPALLAARLVDELPQRHWQVVNASVPGDTAADAYVRFHAHVAAYRPRLVLIALGLNDCHRAANTGAEQHLALFRQNEMTAWGRSHLLRALAARFNSSRRQPSRMHSISTRQPPSPILPLDDYRDIMIWLARQCRRLGSQPAFLTLTPIHSDGQDGAGPEGSAGEWGLWADYNQAIRDLGRARNGADYSATPVIEVSHKFASVQNWIEDGVHLSFAGQSALAERVWQGLQRPNLAPALALQGQASNAEMAPSLD